VCGYLGTDPAMYGMPQADTRAIDYPARQRELAALNAAIREANGGVAMGEMIISS